MWQFVVMYRRPAQPDAFDRHYREVHVPLTWTFPGLRRMTISKALSSAEGYDDVYMISTLSPMWYTEGRPHWGCSDGPDDNGVVLLARFLGGAGD